MKLFLKIAKEQSDEFKYIDQDNCAWESPEDWLFVGILGGCGCGGSDEIAKEAIKVLRLFETPHEKREWSVYNNLLHECLAHWLDSKGLIEHGSGIGGSWLTDKGKQVLKSIKEVESDIKIN